MTPKISLFYRPATVLALASAITLTVTGHSQAAELNWNTTTGDFLTSSNWLVGIGPGTGFPGSLDSAIVANGGTAQYTTAAAKTILELRAAYGGAGAVEISGGNTFTASAGVSVGTQTGAATGLLTLSGTTTKVTQSTGNTLVGTSSASVGTANTAATGILNINAGTTYNHANATAGSFRIGDNTAGQAGTYKGTVNVSGGTLAVAGRLDLGQSAGGVGELVVSNNGAVTVNSDSVVIGRGGLGKLTFSGGTITKAGAAAFVVGERPDTVGGTGVVDHTGGSLAVNGTGELWIGNNPGSTGTYNISSGATISVLNNGTIIGRAGGNGTLNMTGGTITKNGAGNFVAAGSGGTGLVNQSGGSVIVNGGEFYVGNAANSSGTYNVSGAGTSILVNNWIAVGRVGNGVLNLTSGTITKTGTAGNGFTIGTGGSTNQGTVNVSGGLLDIQLGSTYIGEGSLAVLSISGTGEVRAPSILVARNNTTYLGSVHLDGGTLKTGGLSGGAGNSEVDFNGTLIKATAPNALFFDNLDVADIKSGGAIIDTAGFDIGSGTGQVITGTGGLTKQGAGTLNLPGANTYAGNTLVSAGKLGTSTNSLASGNITVSPGATLGVSVAALDQGIVPANLTVSSASLDFDLGTGIGNPTPATGAPIKVAGILTLDGAAASTAVNIAGSDLYIGQFPLIKYASLAGSGGFGSLKVGNLPLGTVATLVNNTGNKSIDLKITAIRVPIWNGDLSAAWDTTTKNWVDQASGTSVAFTTGNPVYFTDTAIGWTAVTLGTTVAPAAVFFNNTLDVTTYSLTGAGKITGAANLTKQGTGPLTLGTANNDYTGYTRIEGGRLSTVEIDNGGSPSPIGASTAAASNLVLAGGDLVYTGATAASNRGFTIAAVESGIDITDAAANLTLSGSVVSTTGSLIKKGLGTLTLAGSGSSTIANGSNVRIEGGRLILSGTGTTPAQAITNTGEIWVGSGTAVGAGLDIINSSLTSSSWLSIGRGNGDTGNVSSLNVTGSTVSVVNLTTGFANGQSNLATQNVSLTNSTLNNTGTTTIAQSRGSTTNFTVAGSSILNLRQLQVALGGGAAAGASNATLTVGGTSVANIGTDTSVSTASIGYDGGAGNLIVKDSGSFLNYDSFTLGDVSNSGAAGTVTLQDNGIINIGAGFVGSGAGNSGLVTQTGGTFSNRGDKNLQIGVYGNGIWNLSGGTVNAVGYTSVARYAGSVSSLNISGGNFNQTAADRAILIGEEGTGSLNVNSTGALNASGELRIGWSAAGIGTVTQTGGTITSGGATVLGNTGTAQGTLNISGGTLNVNKTSTFNLAVGRSGSGKGTLNVSGTAVVNLLNNASIRIGGDTSNANNTVTQSGGTITGYSNAGTTTGGTGFILLGSSVATGTNTYNLNGGTLNILRVGRQASTGIFNFNGGTLKANGDTPIFVDNITQANVLAGGAIIDTNAYNVTITNALLDAGGSGGVTKNGTGILTLAGSNTYLGNTTISAGTLALADNATLRFYIGANGVNNRVTGTGTATLDGDFNIETAGANLTNGNSWTLVDSSVTKTYGASFTVVGFTESDNVWTKVDGTKTWTFSEATGVLTLSTNIGTAYDSWISTYFPGVVDPNIIGPAKDPDGDGSSNALEFALGGQPNSGSDGPKVYSILADSTADADTDKELILTIAVRTTVTPAFAGSPSPVANTSDGLTAYTIQGSLDLAGFTAAVVPVAPAITTGLPAAPSGYEYRSFSLTGSNGLTGKGFLRVKVN